MGTAFDSLYESYEPAYAGLFGETVTLQRGSESTASVAASWVGQGAEIETQTRMGFATAIVDREWLIQKTAYVINESAVTPIAGDRIVDAGGTTWEVMSLPGKPAAESFAYGYEWLLRTKRIAT